jgi:hypothetical protein
MQAQPNFVTIRTRQVLYGAFDALHQIPSLFASLSTFQFSLIFVKSRVFPHEIAVLQNQ